MIAIFTSILVCNWTIIDMRAHVINITYFSNVLIPLINFNSIAIYRAHTYRIERIISFPKQEYSIW